MTSADFEIDQSEIRTKTLTTLVCTWPSHNALHSISILLIICQQIWPAQSIHKVFLQIFPNVALFPRNCVLPSIPEMPWKQNKRTHDTVLLCQTAKAEKRGRVNDHEDTLCELKVVGCLSKKKLDDGSCRSCCRWIGTILDYCSCLCKKSKMKRSIKPSVWSLILCS